MPRENLTLKRERAAEIEQRMFEHYGEGACSLDHVDPFTLTVAVILSAQCTDAAVNKVTPELFARFGTPEAMAAANIEDIEAIIHPLGFFRSKAKNLKACAQTVLAEFGGEVPRTMADLQKLPGVGRKTANVVMSNAFGKDAIAVDTHVFRLANRLGLAHAKDVYHTELQLMENIPKDQWSDAHHWLIWHGRKICSSRKPKCGECPLADVCPSVEKAG